MTVAQIGLMAVVFVLVWAGSALLISAVVGADRLKRPDLADRLLPFADAGWTREVKRWLRDR